MSLRPIARSTTPSLEMGVKRWGDGVKRNNFLSNAGEDRELFRLTRISDPHLGPASPTRISHGLIEARYYATLGSRRSG
jgi:hypothetical protein